MLTADQEKWVQLSSQIEKLKNEIEKINKVAYESMHVKQDEMKVIDNTRIADVQTKEDEIKTLESQKVEEK